MVTHDFAEIEPEFRERADRLVWTCVASVDANGRPRTRLLHPLWEGRTGWVTTWGHSLKVRQLAANPYLSVAYTADHLKTAYVECRAEYLADPALKRHVWDLALATPPPLGFDPAESFGPLDNPGHGVLKLTPYRIALVQFPAEATGLAATGA